MMSLHRGIPISNRTTTNTERGDGKTSIAARGVHAAGQHSYRRVALSRRMAGRQFQFRAYQAADPETRGRKIRRLFHGRPSGRAQHAGQCAQAQPHRHVVRAVHAVVGAGRRHRTYRADRDRLDHLRRALSCRAPLRLAGSHQRRPRRVEYRHHLQSGRGAEFRAGRSHGACRALSPRARILRCGHGPVGLLRRRRLRARRRTGSLFRSRQDARARSQGEISLGARPAQHRPPGAGLAGDRPGRRVGRRPAARRGDRRGRVHRRRQPQRRAKALCRHQGPHGQARPRSQTI